MMEEKSKLLKLSKSILKYDFNNLQLLKDALTHSSFAKNNNERLEFLGDSILNFIVSNKLCQDFPDATEGELTRMRAFLVRGTMLAEIAREFQLGEYLFLGASEYKTGGHQRDSILEDALEAIIAVIYIDSNIDVASQVILGWYKDRIKLLVHEDFKKKDPKTELQEYLQAKKTELPVYNITKTTGDSHQKFFYVTCNIKMINKDTSGTGSSRKDAEQDAAAKMLVAIKQQQRDN